MGLMKVMRAAGAGILLASHAHAGVIAIDNGLAPTATGYVQIQSDDYGAYGTWMGPQKDDEYKPANVNGRYATWLAGAYVFITSPGSGNESAVVLTEEQKWLTIEEGQGQDGIIGTHGLTRSITSMNAAVNANTSQSAFRLAGTDVQLDFALRQELTHDAPTNTTRLEQAYTITNNGLAVDLVFHAHWDPDLTWTTGFEDDIGGVGQGLCFLTVAESIANATDRAIAFTDGGSMVPPSHYYVGKSNLPPTPASTPLYETNADNPIIFNSLATTHGMPMTWRDNLAGVGNNVAGVTPTGAVGNTMIGIEYRFPLAQNATTSITLHRVYGAFTRPCGGGPGCGDTNVTGTEECDSGRVDTQDCNGEFCTFSMCGDGHVNMADNEECESGGVDASHCNFDCTPALCGDGYTNAANNEACDDMVETANCTANCTISSCGDGYVNVAAEEDCEAGALCDVATCQYTFSLGGGCGGCGTSGDGSVILVGVALLAMTRRRYRSSTCSRNA